MQRAEDAATGLSAPPGAGHEPDDVRLVLYSRRYCHLCEEMLTALRLLAPALAVEIVDVDSAPALEAEFGELVPLLMDGRVELARYRLDPNKIRAYLSRTR